MAEYQPPDYTVEQIDLRIELDPVRVRTTSRIRFRRLNAQPVPFHLDGEDLKLLGIKLDGRRLEPGEYTADAYGIVIRQPPPSGTLTIDCALAPGGSGANGVIIVGDALTSHCEPEGFRRITFFPDRPDIMARFGCTLVGSRAAYPNMLSNGRLCRRRDLSDGRSIARFTDERPKPSYLFAFVAGQFDMVSDLYQRKDGRPVTLSVYATPADLPYCRHGLDTLRRALDWDEANYGRVYDGDRLISVIMPGYPGGAMEYPTLNLYSSEFFAADTAISTDAELRRLTASVAHEYFHDWTGNHVSVREWRELSLKEGLTVFREQQFMSDLLGDDEARIDQVEKLRSRQYPEDDGALAHAPRPSHIGHPSNLYTSTVYEKGAEIMRMIETIMSPRAFRVAVGAFLDHYDGQSVSIDQFLIALDPQRRYRLDRFAAWFGHAGAVRLSVETAWDVDSSTVEIRIDPSDTGDAEIAHLPLPVRLGLLNQDGEQLSFRKSEDAPPCMETVIDSSPDRTILLHDVTAPPLLSIFRGLSAPVRLLADSDPTVLAVKARHDTDAVNCWGAMQSLVAMAVNGGDRCDEARDQWLDCFGHILGHAGVDPGRASRLLLFPSMHQLVQDDLKALDQRIAAAARLRSAVVSRYREDLRQWHAFYNEGAGEIGGAAERRTQRMCLSYLMAHPDRHDIDVAEKALGNARTMDEAVGALVPLLEQGGDEAEKAILLCRTAWADVPAKLDNLFLAIGSAEQPGAIETGRRFLGTRELDLGNAPRLKALFDRLATNPVAFHRSDGEGYRLMGDLMFDLRFQNPALAARFSKAFSSWRELDPIRRDQARRTLETLANTPDLSRQLSDRVSSLLG